MLRMLLLALAIAACAPAPRALTATPMPPGESYSIVTDLTGCRAAAGAFAPTYDGAAWRIGETSAPVRCSLPLHLQLADYVFDVEVLGEHLTAGPQVVTACAQFIEFANGTRADVMPCGTSTATTASPFDIWTRAKSMADDSWFGLNEDYALSLVIHGNGAPVPTGGGSVIYGARLHMTRQ